MATKTARTGRLNRRRYLEVTRLLKEVIGNKQAGLARRMKAADMLLGVFDRHDKALERKERRTTEATATGSPETAPELEAPKEETVDEFLARIAGMTAAKSAGTTTGVEPLEDDEDDEDKHDEE